MKCTSAQPKQRSFDVSVSQLEITPIDGSKLVKAYQDLNADFHRRKVGSLTDSNMAWLVVLEVTLSANGICPNQLFDVPLVEVISQ